MILACTSLFIPRGWQLDIMPTNPRNDKSCTITVAAAIVVQADLKAGISLSSEKRSARPRTTGKPSNLKPSVEIPKLPER